MKRPTFKSTVLGTLLLACGACSSGDTIDTTTSWLGPLHRYEQLSGTGDFGVYLLKDTGNRPAIVGRIVASPAEVTVSVQSDLNAISPTAYEQLRATFSASLTKSFASDRRNPDAGDDKGDAYFVRAALTNLTVKKVSNEFGLVGLKDLEFGFEDAALEIGIYERRTNARRAVIIEKVQGKKVRWDVLRERFTGFAERVAEKTSEARAAIDKKASQPAAPALKKPAEPSKK